MADAEIEATEATEEQQKPKGKLMPKLIVAVLAVVVLGAGAAGGILVLGRKSATPAEDSIEVAENAAATQQAPEAADGPELYQSLLPPLVVNIKDANGDVHYMQMSMEAMAREQSVINAIRDHTTVIRNNLILLYGSATYEAVITREGKEKLLSDGLAEIQNIMKPHIGDGNVEALYFTGLVIQ